MNKTNKSSLRIFITAGPVWVPIDTTRVITNIFGGALGFSIAKEAHKRGHRVTLLMGPGRVQLPKSNKRFNIIKFKYYKEILNEVKNQLRHHKYDVMIHSAAVSDYMPTSVFSGKIKSGKRHLTLHLKPTIKIVNLIKKIRPRIFLVKFKLEINKTERQLINIAYRSMVESKADLIVANDLRTVITNHKAFIINKYKKYVTVVGKDKIAKKLIGLIEKNLDK